jgi:tetratricopeptide (TPR) repeat protein
MAIEIHSYGLINIHNNSKYKDLNPEQISKPYLNKGKILFQQGKYDEALDAFTRAIEIYPNHMKTLYKKIKTLKINKTVQDKYIQTHSDLIRNNEGVRNLKATYQNQKKTLN